MEETEKQQGQRHGPLALVFPMNQRLSRQARQEGTDDLASVACYLVEPSILMAFLSLSVTLTFTPFLSSSSLHSLPSQVILASLATSQVCSFFSLSSMVSLPSPAFTTLPSTACSSAANAREAVRTRATATIRVRVSMRVNIVCSPQQVIKFAA